MCILNNLPFILRHENIARLVSDKLYVLDRRVYPFEKRYEVSKSARDSAKIIKDMVTQGGGPLEVALKTILLVINNEGLNLSKLKEASILLSLSRPTNTTMKRELDDLLLKIESLIKLDNAREKIEELVQSRFDFYDNAYIEMAKRGANLIEDGDGILTTCFAEHSFIMSLYLARKMGKNFTVYVPETRPYLQGARLTAPSLYELGFDVKLISDGMSAHFASCKKITKYMTATDLTLKDRTIVNKVGTLNNAIIMKHYNIPYYAFAISFDQRNKEDIVLEYRDSKEVKYINSKLITLEEIEALYPCFDIIDSSLVTKIIMPNKEI